MTTKVVFQQNDSNKVRTHLWVATWSSPRRYIISIAGINIRGCILDLFAEWENSFLSKLGWLLRVLDKTTGNYEQSQPWDVRQDVQVDAGLVLHSTFNNQNRGFSAQQNIWKYYRIAVNCQVRSTILLKEIENDWFAILHHWSYLQYMYMGEISCLVTKAVPLSIFKWLRRSLGHYQDLVASWWWELDHRRVPIQNGHPEAI